MRMLANIFPMVIFAEMHVPKLDLYNRYGIIDDNNIIFVIYMELMRLVIVKIFKFEV